MLYIDLVIIFLMSQVGNEAEEIVQTMVEVSCVHLIKAQSGLNRISDVELN